MKCKKALIFTAALAWMSIAVLGQSIMVTTPNGGERWMIGDPVVITWTATGMSGNVRINLIRTGGAVVGTIASSVPVADGSFPWTAGALSTGMAESAENYLVRVRSTGTETADNSNAAFALVGREPNIKISTMRAIGWDHTFTPRTFSAGDPVIIKYYLQNDSSYSAGAFNVGLRVGGAIVARNAYAELVNGGEASGEFAWTATCGSPIAVVADCDGAVAENNEGDNVMTDPELACSQPDLNFFTALSCSSGNTTPKAGLRYEFRAQVDATPVKADNVRVKGGIVGGAMLYDHTFPTLVGDGGIEPVSFIWEVPEGANRIYFEIDPDNTIAESNERNNRQELAITGVVSTPATEHYDIRTTINKTRSFGLLRRGLIEVKRGKPLTVRGEVSGTTGAVRDIKITAWVVAGKTRTPLYEQSFSSIASLTVPFSFSWTPAVVGENTLVVKAELGPYAVGAGVVDSNPANNTDSVRVTVLETTLRPLR
jgi:hypothetical protein